MTLANTHGGPRGADQVGRLLQQLTLSQATGLARAGSYGAAEELLSGLGAAGGADASVLDLLARIRAQQGTLFDAVSLWKRAQTIDPSHLGAAAGLERIRRMQGGRYQLRFLVGLVTTLAVVACAVALFADRARRQSEGEALLQQRLAEVSKLGDFGTKVDAWAADQRSAVRHLESLWQVSSNQMDGLSRAFARDLAAARTELNGQLSAVQGDGVKLAALQEAGSQRASNQMATLLAVVNRERALTAEVEAGRAASEKLLAEFRALEARYNVVSAEAGLATNPPGVNVAVPGVTASVSGREVAVVFEEGLFDHGTHLKLGARDRLLAVAKCLAQPPDPVQIKVVGFADDDRAFLKWTARWEAGLAQERASAVVGYFIGLGLFKPEQLLATSGAATRPFANDTEENRARNRTVVLQVSRSQGLR